MQRIWFFSNARRWVTSIALVAVLLVLGALAPTPTHAAPKATFVVNSLLDNTTDDTSCTLREAINAANNAATNANCGANSSADDTITFSVSGIITLGSTLPDIVSGQGTLTINGGGTVTISGATTYRVFVVNSGANLTLQNVTIANGNCGSTCRGGGIYSNGTLTVTNSTFSGNTATTNGGGIYNDSGGTATVTNSTFSGNTATTYGSGIFTYYGTVNVTNSTFSGNSASIDGCGIYNDGGTATVTNSTFSGNTATRYGGGIYSNSTLTVTNSTFSGNTATTYGGGIYSNGTLTVTNSTFFGNIVGYGGGIYSDSGGTAKVTNSTFSSNWAESGSGSGIYNGTTTKIKNSIIANSTKGGNCSGTTITNDGNNIDDGTTCGWGSSNGSMSNTNPQLGTLTGNPQYYPLNYNSPAIDGVTYNAPNSCPSTDERGEPRDDLGCDIGAYEMKMTDRNNVTLQPSSSTLTTYGPARAGIQYSGTNPGATTATKVTNWTGGTPANTLGVWWELTAPTNTGLNLNLELCYSTAELGNLTESGAHFWRYNGSWNDMGAASFSGTTPNRCAQITGVTDLSRWTIANASPGIPPTAVTLSSFRATTPSFDLGAWLKQFLGR